MNKLIVLVVVGLMAGFNTGCGSLGIGGEDVSLGDGKLGTIDISQFVNVAAPVLDSQYPGAGKMLKGLVKSPTGGSGPSAPAGYVLFKDVYDPSTNLVNITGYFTRYRIEPKPTTVLPAFDPSTLPDPATPPTNAPTVEVPADLLSELNNFLNTTK